MTINEIELYDVEAVDEVLSHLSNGDANVFQVVSKILLPTKDGQILLEDDILQRQNVLYSP